jgi:hypothetical protein
VNKSRFGLIAATALLVGALFLSWTNRYNIYDWMVLQNYTPPVAVVDLADKSGFNDYGKRLFYVNKPEISGREAFVEQCKVREQTIVLGCYTNPGIFVFDVQDERLKGVEEVTAAHEMLHAAYERLSPSERKRIDALTEEAYSKINDPELAKRIESYKQTEPGEIPNELHSILGTEKRNVGSELEEYYKQYFIDRLVVVALAENYEKVFVDIQNQVQRYDADLSLRKAEIERREQGVEAQSNELQSIKQQMNSLLAAKSYAAYNNLVPTYNTKVKAFNAEINQIEALITEYNELVAQRNNLAADQETLVKSIDSRLNTLETQ